MHCQGCLLIAFNVVLNVAEIMFVSYSEQKVRQEQLLVCPSSPSLLNHSSEDRRKLQPVHDSDNDNDDNNTNDDDPCPEDG